MGWYNVYAVTGARDCFQVYTHPLFQSAATLLYFGAILASFKKKLKFKSKDIYFLSISQKYFVCHKEPEYVLLPLKSSPRNRASSKPAATTNLPLVWLFTDNLFHFSCGVPWEGTTGVAIAAPHEHLCLQSSPLLEEDHVSQRLLVLVAASTPAWLSLHQSECQIVLKGL